MPDLVHRLTRSAVSQQILDHPALSTAHSLCSCSLSPSDLPGLFREVIAPSHCERRTIARS